MNKEILVFYDNEIGKHRFYYSKNPIMIFNVDAEKYLIRFILMERAFNTLLVTNFDVYEIKPSLCIICSKMKMVMEY